MAYRTVGLIIKSKKSLELVLVYKFLDPFSIQVFQHDDIKLEVEE